MVKRKINSAVPLKQYKTLSKTTSTTATANNGNRKKIRPWCTVMREHEDPFDKLIKNDNFEDLRKKNVIKKCVRPEFNQDSSVDNSIIDDGDYFCDVRASTPNKNIAINMKTPKDLCKNLLTDLTDFSGGLPDFSSLKVQNIKNLITIDSELLTNDGTSFGGGGGSLGDPSNSSDKEIIASNSTKKQSKIIDIDDNEKLVSKINQKSPNKTILQNENPDSSSNSFTKSKLSELKIKNCHVKIAILPEFQSFINVSSAENSHSTLSTSQSIYLNQFYKGLTKNSIKHRRKSFIKHKRCRKKTNNSIILINNDDEDDNEMKSLSLNFKKLSTSTKTAPTTPLPLNQSTNQSNISLINLKKCYVRLSTTDTINLSDLLDKELKNHKQYVEKINYSNFSNCYVKLYKISIIERLIKTNNLNFSTTSHSVLSTTINIQENELSNSYLSQRQEILSVNNQILPNKLNDSEFYREPEMSLSLFENHSYNLSKIDNLDDGNYFDKSEKSEILYDSSFLMKKNIEKPILQIDSINPDEHQPLVKKRSKRMCKSFIKYNDNSLLKKTKDLSLEISVSNNVNHKKRKVSKKSETSLLDWTNIMVSTSFDSSTNDDEKLYTNSYVKLTKLDLDSFNLSINPTSPNIFDKNHSMVSSPLKRTNKTSLNYVNRQRRKPVQNISSDNNKDTTTTTTQLNNKSKILFSPYPVAGTQNGDQTTVTDKSMVDLASSTVNEDNINQSKRKKVKRQLEKLSSQSILQNTTNELFNLSSSISQQNQSECYVLLTRISTPIKNQLQYSISSDYSQLQITSPKTPQSTPPPTPPSIQIPKEIIENNSPNKNHQRLSPRNFKENNAITNNSTPKNVHITKRRKNKRLSSINLLTPSPSKQQQQDQPNGVIDIVTPLGIRKTNVSFIDLHKDDQQQEEEETGNNSTLFSLPKIIPLKSLQPGKWRRSIAQWKRDSIINNKDNVNIPATRTINADNTKQPTNDQIDIDSSSASHRFKSFYNRKSIAVFPSSNSIINVDPSIIEVDNEISRTEDCAFVLEQTDVVSTNSKETSFSSESIKLRRSISFGSPKTIHPIVINDSTNLLLDARSAVLRRCGQSEPLLFNDIYSKSALKQCRKIGEGVYGEVFMNKCPTSGKAIVLKIIPIENDVEINGEQQKKFHEILSEVVIAMELSSLRNDRDEYMTQGFVEVVNVRCVKGQYPEHLLDLWELYRDNQGTYNDHPEIFTNEQLYIVLELANAGQDLEAFQFHNAQQSLSAFQQTALTLAVAEKKYQFEHRDLHWGNILLQATDEPELTYKLNGEIITVPTHGVKVTIIDYTLSHMIFENHKLFNDLSNDNELFSATGDYQYDIYRLMKDRLANDWKRYDPYTNILWLHYTVDKMINGARYKNTKTRKHRQAIQDMMRIRDDLLEFNSAYETIVTI